MAAHPQMFRNRHLAFALPEYIAIFLLHVCTKIGQAGGLNPSRQGHLQTIDQEKLKLTNWANTFLKPACAAAN
jgi:hypothetical protein